MTGAVNNFGPHHFLRNSVLVHAFQTASRGASNKRVMVSSSLFFIVVAMVTPPSLALPQANAEESGLS